MALFRMLTGHDNVLFCIELDYLFHQIVASVVISASVVMTAKLPSLYSALADVESYSSTLGVLY